MPILIFLLAVFGYIYAEISLLVFIGSNLGVIPLILLMIGISVAGLWLIKLRGAFTLLAIRQQLSEGKIPTQAVISSLFFAMAGVLLLIPGFLSDILAMILILPFTRKFAEVYLFKFLKSKVNFTFFRSSANQPHSQSTVFDAEFEKQQDSDKWIK